VIQEMGLAKTIQVANVTGAAGAIGISQFSTNQKGDGQSLLTGGFGMVASFLLQSRWSR
jgi:putative tricarboxylic transport membrane protein